MSVQTEINRIKTAVTAIVSAIRGKGVTVPSSAKIGDLAPLIESIPTGGGDTIGTCTVVLDVSDMVANTPNTARVFYTAYGDGLSAEFMEVQAWDQSELRLYNVVCGSAIYVHTDMPMWPDSNRTRYTDDREHCIVAPDAAGSETRIVFYDNT